MDYVTPTWNPVLYHPITFYNATVVHDVHCDCPICSWW